MSDERLLSAEDRADLLAVARALYPHHGLGDGPYRRAVDALVARAEREPAVLHALTDGLEDLRLHQGLVPGIDEAQLRGLLEERTDTAFFTVTRAGIAWELYDDREVWAYIGYPGAAFEQGGYLNRGFSDLDWLPEPRIEESDQEMPEIVPPSNTGRHVA